MDSELRLLVNAVSQGRIKHNYSAMKIVRDALCANIDEAKELYDKGKALRTQFGEYLIAVQDTIAVQDQYCENLLDILATNAQSLREIEGFMAEYVLYNGDDC